MWRYGIVVILAWGVTAFGGVYRWAYGPMLAASLIVGCYGISKGRAALIAQRSLYLALAVVAFAIALQLLPLPLSVLEIVSPHSVRLVNQLAIQVDGASRYHAISLEPSRTLTGLVCFGVLAVFMLGVAVNLERGAVRRLVWSITLLGSFVAVVGIVQNATFNGKIYGFWERQQGGIPFGPFINRNHFAGWMLMVIPLSFGYLFALLSRSMQEEKLTRRQSLLWLATEDGNRALMTGFAIVVMCLALVMTMSRSGMLALALSLFAIAIVLARRYDDKRRAAIAVGMFVLLVAIVTSWVGFDAISVRFTQVDLLDTTERPAIWADTIRIVKDFWLTGTGLNTYGLSTLFYQTSMPGSHLQQAHNDYLQLAAEGGLLLGLPIIIAITVFARELIRRSRRDVGSGWWIRMGAIAGILSVALQSVVEFSLQMPGNAAMFAAIAGVALYSSPAPPRPEKRLS